MSTERHDHLADPAAMLTEVIRLVRPRPGDVVVAVVCEGPSGFGQVEDAMTIHRARADPPLVQEQVLGDGAAASLVSEAAHRLLAGREDVLDEDDDRRYVFVTVVCREGSPSPGAAEVFWRRAWVVVDVDVAARLGGVVTLTDQGWTCLSDVRTGRRPILDQRR